MRYFLISDDPDTLTGMRLSGIEGVLCASPTEVEAAAKGAEENSEIAVLLITEGCAAMIPETVARIKLHDLRPLIAVIPGSSGTIRGADSISGLIREAIGIRV